MGHRPGNIDWGAAAAAMKDLSVYITDIFLLPGFSGSVSGQMCEDQLKMQLKSSGFLLSRFLFDF